jgi:3-phosphoshikimate 1-carboxyvinyltransferase
VVWTDPIVLRCPAPLDAVVRPPGSKSLTNRALLLAALARGRSRLRGALFAEDTEIMAACLRALGITVEQEGDDLVVDSPGELVPTQSATELYVGTAGTVARFLLAALAHVPQAVRMEGSARMRERPMAELVSALRQLGARIEDRGSPGHLPVDIGPHAQPLPGGTVRLARPASSQFVSGVVFAGLRAVGPTRIVLEQGMPARPYVDMTLASVRAFGGRAEWTSRDELEVVPVPLHPAEVAIEPDASAATYLLALAAIHGGRMVIPELGRASHQGDARFCHVLAAMGADVEQDEHETRLRGGTPLRGGTFDLSDMPDTTPTLAVLAVFASGPTRISGVEVLRHHESDRLAALAGELARVGAGVTERPDGLDIVPPIGGPRRGMLLHTHRDHRMAMSLALLGDVALRDPGCVAKTFPRYFDELDRLGMVVGSA